MTNKEAYEIIEKSIRCNNNDCPPVSCDECPYSVKDEQFNEAFQMAMEALKEPGESVQAEEQSESLKMYRFGNKVAEGFRETIVNAMGQEPKQSDSGFTTRINPEIMHDRTTDDLISRDEAIDDLHGQDPSRIWDTADIEVWVNGLPSVQPEQGDAEFWRGRAKEYRECFFGLYDKVMQGFVADAINLNENGMTLKIKKPSARIQPDVKIITSHLKHRLWETARNNLGLTGDLGDAYADIAEHRLDAWMDEIIGTNDAKECEVAIKNSNCD